MLHNMFFAGDIDVTVVLLSGFVLFFLGLVVYLRREDRREGYPLEDDVTGRLEPGQGLFFVALPKTFHLPHGEGSVTKPNATRDTRPLAARATSRAPGSPLEPTGDPMRDGVGPAAFAQRAKRPDLTLHGQPKIAPLRVATDFSLDRKDPDPRGMKVVGADRKTAGTVSDVWIDRGEYLIRYLEVELALAGATGRRVLLPMPMAVVDKWRNTVKVDAILAQQFAGVPTLSDPNVVTFDEEERVSAYYGGGLLYATQQRAEPIL
jgi:photosynthetic reaction center H subunit